MATLEKLVLEPSRQLWWGLQDFKYGKIKALNQRFIDGLTDEQILELSKPYIAGYSEEEGLQTVLRYVSRGRNITIDVLGESSLTLEESENIAANYTRFIDCIHQNALQKSVSISLKATSLCHVTSWDDPVLSEPDSLIPRLEQIVRYAKERGVDVTLDMEGSKLTDISLDAAKYLWNKGYDNFGIVLQTMLKRTQEDVIDMFVKENYSIPKNKLRVRVVRGIYDEPREIATISKSEAKYMLIDRVAELLDAGVYVEIGTHDKKIVNKLMKKVIMPRLASGQITKDDFEFQFLMGVHNGYELGDKLITEGFKVRYYGPIQTRDGAGLHYMRRRLKAHSGFVLSGAKNFVQNSWYGHQVAMGLKQPRNHV